MLRFIPYLGPWLAASFPITLAFVVDPGWSKLSMTVGLFLVLELTSNNILEPWLYGVSTGISNFALIVAAVFWTWLWGPVGLFLSTPLTVCLVVIGTYIPGLKFISVLLGNAPALSYDARLYQRMLAMDYSEMLALARQYVAQHDCIAFYDEVLIPALIAAETDRHEGTLAEIRQQSVLENTRDLIEALSEEGQTDTEDGSNQTAPVPIVIAPARDEVDELAGMVLAHMLRDEHIQSTVISARLVVADWTRQVDWASVKVLCISKLRKRDIILLSLLSKQLMEAAGNRRAGLSGSPAAGNEMACQVAPRQVEALPQTLDAS